MPRMRTIQEVANYFKETDPETQISVHFIRNTIESGFPVVKTGTKTLVNLDLFLDYLNGSFNPIKNKDFSITEK